MRVATLVAAITTVAACYDPNAGVLPIVGIWEMDTTLTQYLASEPRVSETFTCSQRGDRVRCAMVSERVDGMTYATRFEAKVGGPRALVSGLADVQEVQLSDDEEPYLDIVFYNRNRPAYSWRTQRSPNGDTLYISRIDITPEGPRAAKTTYHRVRRELP